MVFVLVIEFVFLVAIFIIHHSSTMWLLSVLNHLFKQKPSCWPFETAFCIFVHGIVNVLSCRSHACV